MFELKHTFASVALLALALTPMANAQVFASGAGLPGLKENPAPLRLPPGLLEVLPLDKRTSYFADAARMVDCTNPVDLPFGTCHNLLFGGPALMSTHLEGSIMIRFSPPVGNISHFEISHPLNLYGDDTVLKAPQHYEMPVLNTFVLDPLTKLSSGDLNLATGEISNFSYNVLVSNSWYNALQSANPKLIATAFSFPGPYGFAQPEFRQRADGLLDFVFRGGTFLPLGGNIQGDPIRIPLPLCGPLVRCGSLEALGTSLHPTLQISTVAMPDEPCGANCPTLTPNSYTNFTTFSRNSTVGDNFNLNVPEIGAPGPARSQMTGRIQVQFGERRGNYMPFIMGTLPPEGLMGPAPAGTPIGFSLGMLGTDEYAYFPRQTYLFSGVATGDDPFTLSVGEVDVTTGKMVGSNFNFRTFFVQSVFLALARMNPGVRPASEPFPGPISFEKGVNGQTLVRFNGEMRADFTGFVFPRPDGETGYFTGPNSILDLFFRVQGIKPADRVGITKTGSATNVVSSLKDTFSYTYAIPCSTNGIDNAQFTYTNGSTGTFGGTFKLNSVTAVTCFNSRTSQSRPGEYDTVQFTGFGSWSKDSNPHIINAQISTSATLPYVHILIDAGTISQANTKPTDDPRP